MQRTVWADSYSGMFRSSSAAAAPQRQPLLQSNQQKVSPPKKTLTSGLRNLLFHNGEESPEHHGREDHGAESPPTPPAPPMKSSAPTKIKQVVPEFVPPTPVSPPSRAATVKKGNPRDTFHRANSHPIRLDASAALSASRSFDPSMTRAAALDPTSLQSPSRTASGDLPQQTQPSAAPSLRSTVFGSCSHVLSTVVGVLFQTIKLHQEFIEPHVGAELASSDVTAADSKVRKAKLLYIALLEKAQKERGEWQGFTSKDTNQASNNEVDEDQEPLEESTTDVLLAALTDLTKEDAFAVLHELLELSYRNLRVSLVTPAVYSKHKSELAKESLTSPVSLTTLLRVGGFVNDLNRDEKSCMLRLMNLWHARCIVDRDQQQELRRIIEERYPLILTECSEAEFMQQAARKSARLDPVAVDLLMVMVQHRDLLFCDVELFTIRHEMQLTPSLPALAKYEIRQPEEPKQLERPEGTESEPDEHQTPEEIDEDLYQDASTQADPPEIVTQDAETQVTLLQTHDSGTQIDEHLTQDARTQVEYDSTKEKKPPAPIDQVSQDEDEPSDGGAGIQPPLSHEKGGEDMVAKSSVSIRPEGDELLDNESIACGWTNLKMAALPQSEPHQTEAIDAGEPISKKKKIKSKKTVKKTGSHKSRGRASARTETRENADRLQACDSSQTKPRLNGAPLPLCKIKRTPRIAVPLVARTQHIHHQEVSQHDSIHPAGETVAVAELSPSLETMPRDGTITYTHVGLSIAAAALGAVATLALQAIRKHGH